MGFPVSFEQLGILLAAEKDAVADIKLREEELKKQTGILKGQHEAREVIVNILRGLMESWKEPNPGKYKDAYFCVDSVSDKPAVVSQLLPQDAMTFGVGEEWSVSYPSGAQGKLTYSKSSRYPVINLSRAARGVCPHCKTEQLIIEKYGEEDDIWLRRRLIVCLDCQTITPLSVESIGD